MTGEASIQEAQVDPSRNASLCCGVSMRPPHTPTQALRESLSRYLADDPKNWMPGGNLEVTEIQPDHFIRLIVFITHVNNWDGAGPAVEHRTKVFWYVWPLSVNYRYDSHYKNWYDLLLLPSKIADGVIGVHNQPQHCQQRLCPLREIEFQMKERFYSPTVTVTVDHSSRIF